MVICIHIHVRNTLLLFVSYFSKSYTSSILYRGYFSATSAGRQPVGISQMRNLSFMLLVFHASLISKPMCMKLILMGFHVCTGLVIPYTGFTSGNSSWKVPNHLSQKIKICP